jgi:hypothetical protein
MVGHYRSGTYGQLRQSNSKIYEKLMDHGANRYKIHRSGKWDYDVVSAYGSENRQAGHRGRENGIDL